MSLSSAPEPPRDKLDTTILIVQGALGVFAALVGAAPSFVSSLSPELVIVTIAALLLVIAALAVIKSRHSVQKYKIYAESMKDIESDKSWNESTRALTQNAEKMGNDRNMKFEVYSSIISAFEDSAKDQTKNEVERKAYAEIITRLRDMRHAARDF
jgi:hypothetical protein